MVHVSEGRNRSKAAPIVMRTGLGVATLAASYGGLVGGLGAEPAQWLFAVAVMLMGILLDRLLRR